MMRVKVLKVITAIAWVVLITGAMALDSPDITMPVCGYVVSICWLILIMTANSFDLSRNNGEKKKHQLCQADTSAVKKVALKPNPLYQNHKQKAIHVEEFKKRFREHL